MFLNCKRSYLSHSFIVVVIVVVGVVGMYADLCSGVLCYFMLLYQTINHDLYT